MVHRFSASSGTRLHVEDAGKGPVVVAVHGLAGGAYFFGGLTKRLQSDYRVISIDLPGTGRSIAGTPHYSMESWIQDLGELVAKHIDKPIVLIGHSMGTIVALKAWAAWPEYIRGLAFVGGLPKVRPVIRERLTERLNALAGKQDLIGFGEQVSPGVFSALTMREQPEVVASFERLYELNSVETYDTCCRILLGADAEDVLPTVSVPCIGITGDEDQYAPSDAVKAFLQQIPQPGKLQVMPGCGHLPFLEVPELFASTIKAFLRSC
jgi:pimeloyl-ACP methyl ester carboxylesterase